MRPPSYKLTAASLRCCFLVFLGYHDLLTLTAISHRRTLIESNLAKTRAPLVHGSRGGTFPTTVNRTLGYCIIETYVGGIQCGERCTVYNRRTLLHTVIIYECE